MWRISSRTLMKVGAVVRPGSVWLVAGRSLSGQQGLPRLPVPPLQQSCRLYLDFLEPVLPPEELRTAAGLVEEFQRAGGAGERLQARLESLAQISENYMTEFFLKPRHLIFRDPLVVYKNFGLVLPRMDFREKRGQIRCAAQLIAAALHIKQMVESGTLQDQDTRGKLLCMKQYEEMMSSCRIPGPEQDSVEFYSHKHITVVHNCQFFVLDVFNRDGTPLTVDQLCVQLETICSASPETATEPVGILTTEHRDIWSKTYSALIRDNRESVSAIQSSIFTVCLDGPAGSDVPDHAAAALQILHGGGSSWNSGNRWFDKGLQLIVGEDGTCGVNVSHVTVDGTVGTGFSDHLIEHMQKLQAVQSPAVQCPGVQSPGVQSPGVQSPAVQSPGVQSPAVQSPAVQSPGVQSPGVQSPGVQSPGVQSPAVQSPAVQSPGVQSPAVQSPAVQCPAVQSPGVQSPGVQSPGVQSPAEPLPVPQKLQFHLTAELRKDVEEAQQHLDTLTRDLDLRVLVFEHFGKDVLKALKVSPDAFVHMALQLAYYRIYQRMDRPMMEPVSQRRFRLGRLTFVNTISAASAAFVKAFDDPDKQNSEKVKLLERAVKAHRSYLDLASSGQGSETHLWCLMALAMEENTPMPPIFTDSSIFKSVDYSLWGSQISSKNGCMLFTGTEQRRLFETTYNITNNHIRFNLSNFEVSDSSTESSAARLLRSVEATLLDMKTLLEESRVQL